METKFKINGFHCEACVKLATMKIQKMEGVKSVNIDKDGNSIVESDKDITNEIEKVVESLGYNLEK